MHAVLHLSVLVGHHLLRSRSPRDAWSWGQGGGGVGLACFPWWVSDKSAGPGPSRPSLEPKMSGWTLGSGLPPAVHRSRGDGRWLTRGAEAARRGLDHWPAEGAPPGARPAQPGPLICLYYQQKTKLPGTDVPAPSALGNPQHALTSAPPACRP